MIALWLYTALISAKPTDIALLHRPPTRLEAGKPFVISGTMIGSADVERAEVRFRMSGGSFFERAELELKQGDDYEGAIPGDKVRVGIIEYYVVAFDFLGKTREVFATAKRPQRVLVEAVVEQAQPPPSEETRRPPIIGTGVQPAPVVEDKPALEAPPPLEPRKVEALQAQRTVFGRDDLDAMAVLTLADVLERVPELQISRAIDGRYQVARAGLRDAAAVLILIDGQPLDSMALGAPDLRLPIGVYERVEVSLASESAIDLTGALVTVRLTTRKQKLDARVLAGAYVSQTTGVGAKNPGTYDGAVSGGGRFGLFDAHARAAVHSSGGAQPLVRQDQLSAVGLSLAPGLVNDRALRLHGGASVAMQLPGSHQLALNLDFVRLDHGHYAGGYDLYSPSGGIDSNNLRAQLVATAPTGAPFSYRAALGYRLLTANDQRLVVPPSYRTSDRDGDGRGEFFPDGVTDIQRFTEHVIDLDAQAGLDIGALQKLRARVTVAQHFAQAAFLRNATLAGVEAPLATNDLPQVPGPRASRTTLHAAVSDHLTPWQWLEIDAGLRFSAAGDIGIGGGDLGALLTPVVSVSARPWTRGPDDGLLLRLSYDTSARAPTLLETYAPAAYDGRGIAGNPALRYMAFRQAALDVIYAAPLGAIRLRAEGRVQYIGARGARLSLDPTGAGEAWSDTMSTDGVAASAFLKAGFAARSWVRMGVSWHRAYATVTGIDAITLLTDTPQLTGVAMAQIELGIVGDIYVGATFYSERRNNARTDDERRRVFALPATAIASAQFQSHAFFGVRATLLAQNVFDTERFDDTPRADRLPGLVPREGFRLLAGLQIALDGGKP